MVKGVPVKEFTKKNDEELVGELKRLRVNIIYNYRKNYKPSDSLKLQVPLLLKSLKSKVSEDQLLEF